MKKFENILVAFDLNKTLFFKSESPLPRYHDKKIKKLFFYYRPHLKQLVDYLHTNKINYCFWSNMLGHNCIKYIKQLQQLGMSKYCGIFDQDFCDKTQLKSQTGQIVKSIKNLHKLAKLFQIDVQNCVLVDDSKSKNVQGCNLIEVTPFQGQQHDKQILNVIQKLKDFRKITINPNIENLPMLKFSQARFIQLPTIKKKKVQKIQKPLLQPSDLDRQMQKNPQLQKLKKDLILQKQVKKNTISQIQNLQKKIVEMGDQIKKKSEGKIVRKGDDLLMQVLMFAKQKKVSQKKLLELKQRKKTSEQKIEIIKKLMKNIVQKLNSQLDKKQQGKNEICKQKQQTITDGKVNQQKI